METENPLIKNRFMKAGIFLWYNCMVAGFGQEVALGANWRKMLIDPNLDSVGQVVSFAFNSRWFSF